MRWKQTQWSCRTVIVLLRWSSIVLSQKWIHGGEKGNAEGEERVLNEKAVRAVIDKQLELYQVCGGFYCIVSTLRATSLTMA